METFYPSWKHLFLETFMETFGNTAGSNMLKKQQKKHKANGSMIPCSTICFHPPPVRGGNRKHFGWKLFRRKGTTNPKPHLMACGKTKLEARNEEVFNPTLG